jgi:pimeloyl-ACP methyl ester carboxylesterase
MIKKQNSSYFFLLLAIALYGCYQPGGPIPGEPRSPAAREPVPQKVIVEQVMIFSPAPADNGRAPTDCDYIRYLRYRPEAPDGASKEVNAILVLIPGYLAGANAFDYLARQLVSMAEAMGNGGLEVWAVERRTNCLEDLTGMEAAEREGDPQIAIDYYYFRDIVDGRQFNGFFDEEDVPYLSEFGLQLLMEDIYTIITTKIPHREDRMNTVFIGGHSLGAPLALLFAGWDFDGDPGTLDDAGFRNCAGLVGLEGKLGSLPPTIDEITYERSLADLRSGKASRLNSSQLITQEALALVEILGLYAALAPDEESPLIHEIPLGKEVERLMRLFHSRNVLHYLRGIPALGDFRFTNEAMLGIFFDDNFQPITIFQASLGFLAGGTVIKKEFPVDLEAFPLREFLIDTDELFIAWDAGSPFELGSGPLYSWVPFDQIGNANNPEYRDQDSTLTYTTMPEEVTDIQDFAELLYQGPSNFTEWYYASRLDLDLLAVASPSSANHGLSFLHKDKLGDIAKIELLAPDAEGYNHVDVLCAAVDRPSHRENEIFEPLVEFILNHTGGSIVPEK